MDNENMETASGMSYDTLPAPEEKIPFQANRREIWAALGLFILSYCYTGILMQKWQVWFAVFTAGFILITEYLYYGLGHKKESWIWLGCLLVMTVSLLFPSVSISRLAGCKVTERVWSQGLSALFVHGLAVYWVLSRNWRLSEGESGRLLLLDLLDGLIVFPFKHFFLRIRTLLFGLKQLRPKESKAKPAQIVGTVVAVIAALWLFYTAVSLLGEADTNFSSITEKVTGLFKINWNEETILRILFSLPVGAFLFGLIAGSGRENPSMLRARGDRVLTVIGSLRCVPEKLWIVVLTIFSALYAAFFLLQGSYLFGAFTRTLPEGFVVSQYAREGFFELCKVMALNFALLWCVTRSSGKPVHGNKILLAMCSALLAESMIFSVIAFSKLALYIDCFGFTPLRLQSSWLVCVLFAGSAASLTTLLTGKKTLRIWMVFSVVTLSFLHLY